MLNALKDKNVLPDIVLLCETFLTDQNASRISFENYDLVSEYRKHKKQGCVSIIIKSNIKYMERPDLCIFDEGKFESISHPPIMGIPILAP